MYKLNQVFTVFIDLNNIFIRGTISIGEVLNTKHPPGYATTVYIIYDENPKWPRMLSLDYIVVLRGSKK